MIYFKNYKREKKRNNWVDVTAFGGKYLYLYRNLVG